MTLKAKAVLGVAGEAGWLWERKNSLGQTTKCTHSKNGTGYYHTKNSYLNPNSRQTQYAAAFGNTC